MFVLNNINDSKTLLPLVHLIKAIKQFSQAKGLFVFASIVSVTWIPSCLPCFILTMLTGNSYLTKEPPGITSLSLSNTYTHI